MLSQKRDFSNIHTCFDFQHQRIFFFQQPDANYKSLSIGNTKSNIAFNLLIDFKSRKTILIINKINCTRLVICFSDYIHIVLATCKMIIKLIFNMTSAFIIVQIAPSPTNEFIFIQKKSHSNESDIHCSMFSVLVHTINNNHRKLDDTPASNYKISTIVPTFKRLYRCNSYVYNLLYSL